jgi:hypothetical protein
MQHRRPRAERSARFNGRFVVVAPLGLAAAPTRPAFEALSVGA